MTDLLDQLKSNKGTVSSALGKELAQQVLNGDQLILQEAVTYASYDFKNPKSKNIRAGAAKILEKVAEQKPELVADHLDRLKPALTVGEPQTRWMIMQVFGYCAALNPKDAVSVLCYAQKYLSEDAGVCLSGAAHQYLGRIGATSKVTAKTVLPILDDALKTASENEVDWILEAFMSILDKLDEDAKQVVRHDSESQLNAKKKSTQNRAMKILKKIKAG